MISIDDFKKVEMSVGEILSVEKIPDTDKLLKLSVDFGMKAVVPTAPALTAIPENTEPVRDIRQIVSGIALHFPDLTLLIGRKCLFVTNLEPRAIKGFESNGMIVAVSTDDGKFSLCEVSKEIPAGVKAR